MALKNFYRWLGERYAQGFENGQRSGFDENIEKFSEQATEESDARVFFEEILVGIVSEDNVTNSDSQGELRAGSKVDIGLLVKNAGGVDLKSGKAKVRLANFHQISWLIILG